MSTTPTTEELKQGSMLYALNPISRRYILKTSDVYLRLLKSGVIVDDDAMNALDLKRREASRARQQGLAESRRPVAAVAAPAAACQPRAESRAEVRDRIVKLAVTNVKHLADCDASSMELELKRLLKGHTARYAPPAKPRASTHARHFVDSDDETSEVTDY